MKKAINNNRNPSLSTTNPFSNPFENSINLRKGILPLNKIDENARITGFLKNEVITGKESEREIRNSKEYTNIISLNQSKEYNEKFDESKTNEIILFSDTEVINKSLLEQLGKNEKGSQKQLVEYLKIYIAKINYVTDALKRERILNEKINKENQTLVKEIKLLTENSHNSKQNLILRHGLLLTRVSKTKILDLSFSYLNISELLNMMNVCKKFCNMISEKLFNIKSWQYNNFRQNGLNDFNKNRNMMWCLFFKYIHNSSIINTENINNKSTSSENVEASSGSERKKTTNFEIGNEGQIQNVKMGHAKGGFLEFNESFLENESDCLNSPGSEEPIECSLLKEGNLLEKITAFSNIELKEICNYEIPFGKEKDIEEIILKIIKMEGIYQCVDSFIQIVGLVFVIFKGDNDKLIPFLKSFKKPPYYLDRLYNSDFYFLNLILFQITFLLKLKKPNIYTFFEEQGIEPTDLFSKTILNLFTNLVQII